MDWTSKSIFITRPWAVVMLPKMPSDVSDRAILTQAASLIEGADEANKPGRHNGYTVEGVTRMRQPRHFSSATGESITELEPRSRGSFEYLIPERSADEPFMIAFVTYGTPGTAPHRQNVVPGGHVEWRADAKATSSYPLPVDSAGVESTGRVILKLAAEPVQGSFRRPWRVYVEPSDGAQPR